MVPGKKRVPGKFREPFPVPQQQNAMGSLHNIDFGVCWASWTVPGKKTGSGKVP